jgi:hypothetical protein
MLVPNTPRSWLSGVFITGESRLPGVFTTGESRLLGVFITGESFWTPGSCFTDFKDHTAIFKGIIILKINWGYFNSIGTCNLCLKKLPYFRDSNRLPGVFITRGSITNMNNSPNIRKNSKSLLGMPIGTRRNCLMKKTGDEKYCDTVPLTMLTYASTWYFSKWQRESNE